MRAHPRSRGENSNASRACPREEGSSPLTRGKLQTRLARPADRGLIPAHAGKTRRRRSQSMAIRAHPRSRGENCPRSSFASTRVGSSPLTRGKPAGPPRPASKPGLIPAHAGKTVHEEDTMHFIRAHPRSRGENNKGGDGTGTSPGSSPLTRGKHFLTCAFIAQIGQILESLELCASSESYSLSDAYATGAPRDRVRSIGLAPPSSRVASSA